jgi:hypothetical protein
MTSDTKGFLFLVTAGLIMLGVGGGVSQLPPDAGYFQWAGLLLALIVAFISGVLGYSYVNER